MFYLPSRILAVAPSCWSFFINKSTVWDVLQLLSVELWSYKITSWVFHSLLNLSLASLFWITHWILRFPFFNRRTISPGNVMLIDPLIWDRIKSACGRQSSIKTVFPSRSTDPKLSRLQKSSLILVTHSKQGIRKLKIKHFKLQPLTNQVNTYVNKSLMNWHYQC